MQIINEQTELDVESLVNKLTIVINNPDLDEGMRAIAVRQKEAGEALLKEIRKYLKKCT